MLLLLRSAHDHAYLHLCAGCGRGKHIPGDRRSVHGDGSDSLFCVEAARIDGSGEFHTFNTIVLPIMKPALAVQAIFQFVANWNSLFLPSLIINSTGKKTLTMFVQMLMGESFRADYGVIFLALSITILPMFVMYFLLSRYIVEGVSLGSVKG